MEEIPELPEWIKTLIEEARDEGEIEGFRRGYANAMDQIKTFADKAYWR